MDIKSKQKNRFFGNIALLLMLSAGMTYGQKTHKITLHVDAATLQNNQNAATVSYFTTSADTEVLDNSSPENFTILVDVGDYIIWNGASTSGSVAVKIKKIKFKRGGRIFSSDEIDGEFTVEAGIVRGSTAKGYIYTIQFQVGDGNKVYNIDPIIKTRQ